MSSVSEISEGFVKVGLVVQSGHPSMAGIFTTCNEGVVKVTDDPLLVSGSLSQLIVTNERQAGSDVHEFYASTFHC